MKKLILFFAILSLLFLPREVKSQATTYDIYLSSLSGYQDAHDNYLKTRRAYLEFKTLKSKSEAEVATKTMLVLRSETMIAYLKLLLERVRPEDSFNLENLIGLEREIGFYTENLELIKSQTTLEDLTSTSKDFQLHYKNTTLKLAPLSATLVNLHLLNTHYRILASAVAFYGEKINLLPDSQPKAKFLQNLQTSENSISSAQAQIESAKSDIALFKNEDPRKLNQKIKPKLESAKSGFQSAYSFLIELGKELEL